MQSVLVPSVNTYAHAGPEKPSCQTGPFMHPLRSIRVKSNPMARRPIVILNQVTTLRLQCRMSILMTRQQCPRKHIKLLASAKHISQNPAALTHKRRGHDAASLTRSTDCTPCLAIFPSPRPYFHAITASPRLCQPGWRPNSASQPSTAKHHGQANPALRPYYHFTCPHPATIPRRRRTIRTVSSLQAGFPYAPPALRNTSSNCARLVGVAYPACP